MTYPHAFGPGLSYVFRLAGGLYSQAECTYKVDEDLGVTERTMA